MIGLMLKDLLNLKKQAKIYLVLIIFYYILGIANEDFSMAGSMIAILAAMIPITAMAYDEKSKWERYALTMPISRTSLVVSKYALGLIFLILASAITMIFSLIFSSIPIKQSILTNIAVLSTGILLISIVFPILFKFGAEKGRILMMLVLFAPTAALILLSKSGFKFAAIDERAITSLIYLSPAVAVIILAASVLISLSIYRKKEF